ncbi:MAG: hypothetical protein EZS28_008309 [Streblomastix strix]|uniref:Uncharacterized protein n=1 Tax=Streblomastix strix TaxID=222440 RepID=A0A5J4WNG6_9EUKA|nr:MAG: hypothetical protein EZS28_008309 [Streblomastix strix]
MKVSNQLVVDLCCMTLLDYLFGLIYLIFNFYLFMETFSLPSHPWMRLRLIVLDGGMLWNYCLLADNFYRSAVIYHKLLDFLSAVLRQ